MDKRWLVVAVVVLVVLLGSRTVFAVKPGATPSNRPEIEHARRIVARIWQKYGYAVTVTSGQENDPVHMDGSLHYAGLAEDYRTRDVASSDLALMISEVKSTLGSDYDVIQEVDHLHVEYDPR